MAVPPVEAAPAAGENGDIPDTHTAAPTAQFVLFDGFDPLDVVAPYEVLIAGSDAMGGGLQLRMVTAEGPRMVTSGTPGISLEATAALDPELPGYIFVAGAAGSVEGDPDAGDETIPVLLSRFAQSSAAEAMRQALANPQVTVVTVRGGGLALAMAGLLEGRTATTHVLGQDLLEATGTEVVRARGVDDGDLISAGGVTSGLDAALYLLAREFGPHIAHEVEKLFEYERRGTVWTTTAAKAHSA
ncbi:DJ-1/PfpI family protein [Nesterenkonia sp.]|uniref:DJ-1/PfpI family protein n=1 Tax=Nesterenkonia sp. TaxID=704201 RepID=UPI002615E95D|nr:DJ-1/PfpI family protein [Nesterenkonia sp.]